MEIILSYPAIVATVAVKGNDLGILLGTGVQGFDFRALRAWGPARRVHVLAIGSRFCSGRGGFCKTRSLVQVYGNKGILVTPTPKIRTL